MKVIIIRIIRIIIIRISIILFELLLLQGNNDLYLLASILLFFSSSFIRLQLLLSIISEGYAGLPLILNITVVDVNTCLPIANAAVDVWHCNAVGVYSHFSVQGNNGGTTTTFMRGMQMTDKDGIATIDTIFPGWYNGRTVHLHVKVHVGGTVSNSGRILYSF